jgi:DNA helicase HerA-like ATPase
LGQLIQRKKYIQGVYNYPILDNPVWYVTKEDLNYIFDQKTKDEKIDFDKDYFLPIGTSPSFSDYEIKINPDKFFGKHAAILGNTGSGKSCTFSSIIQSMFAYDFNGKKLQNAHIIIFDTNGEYKNAFQGTNKKPYKNLKLVNPFNIDKDGLKIPFWFMNYADFDYLFKPSELTQAPLFKTAIGYSKSKVSKDDESNISKHYERFIMTIIESDDLFMKKYHKPGNSWILNPENEIIGLANEIPEHLSDIKIQLDLLGKETNKVNELKIKQELENCFIEYLNQKEKAKKTISASIDHPIYFDFSELISTSLNLAVEGSEGSSQKIREHLSTLKMRLHSYLSDERLSNPLLLSSKEDIVNGLAKYLAFILGDFCKIYQEEDDDVFNHYYKKQLDKKDIEVLKDKEVSQITIIDMSLLPFEVLETVTGLIGRLILEFVSRFSDKERASLPIVLALEEAQNYIPEKSNGEKESISKKIFERIAREGRKYGLSLVISSQRPSELSKTVLSQCNSFIIHRLQNPEDQKYVRQLVSAANEDILQQLPILPQQHAVIMGDAVRSPVQARINTAEPTPNSNDPKFITNWLADQPESFPDYKGIAAAWEKGEKYTGQKEPEAEENITDINETDR